MKDYGREFHIAFFQVGGIFYLEGGAFDESCAQCVRGCSCFRLRLIFNEEKGIIDQLHLKWIGAGNKNEGASMSETMVLSGGQTVLLFSLLVCLLGTSLLTFFGELIMKAIIPKSIAKNEKGNAW